MKRISLIVAGLIAASTLANAAIVANLNGKDITDTQINEAYVQALGGKTIDTLNAEQKRQLIQDYIARSLLIGEAKKEKIEKDPTYTQQLEIAKDNIALSAYQKKIFDSVKIDDATIKTTYENNKNNFVEPARAQTKHILVATEAEAKNIIKDLGKLKGDALDKKFSEIASTKSIDQNSAQRGGELGWITADSVVKPFADATFSLKNGEITKTPVKTQFGYHVILKEKSEPRKQLTLDEVKNFIRDQLKLQEANKLISQKAQELLAKSKIEYK